MNAEGLEPICLCYNVPRVQPPGVGILTNHFTMSDSGTNHLSRLRSAKVTVLNEAS